MSEITKSTIVYIGILVISAVILAVSYTTFVSRTTIDTASLAKNTASSIYSIMLQLAASEQGIATYTILNPRFNITLTNERLVVSIKTIRGTISYYLPHTINYVVPAQISNTSAICIVKRMEKCKPILTICKPENKTCCRLGENIC